MEKTLRVLGGEDESIGHSHSHSHTEQSLKAVGEVSGVSSSVSHNGLRNRGSEKLDDTPNAEDLQKPATSPSKLSAYLNLFGDFVHNM